MSEQDLRANPYVGLRPFFADDSLYFYGREQQTTELLGILRDRRFLGVVGSSGSGKSSLVRAGLLPGLLGGFLVQDRDRWRTVQIKPGDAPMANLAAGLLEAMRQPAAPDPPETLEALEREIREGHTDAVVEFLKPRLEGNANLFLLVDQFEEIFAFASGQDRSLAVPGKQRRSGFFTSIAEGADHASLEPARRKEQARRKAEAADFVDLLLKLAEQRELPIYVALTMRTDFLGDCDLFHGLPEALNRGRYLVPRMTREELRDAVECPALLLNAEVAPRLLDHVLNELGDRFDRLPVLQHALLRTWDKWQSEGRIGPIDLRHFELAGGLEGALRKDAEAALEGLDIRVAERVFKRLTDTDLGDRRIRSPARITQLMAASGADRGAVEGIVRQFKEHGRSFVHGSADGKPDDPRVDISHESLIRQWDRLRDWVDEERRSRDEYRELVTKARKRERGEGALLQDPELQVVIDWWAKSSPSSGWAQRYSNAAGDFDSAERFLNDSAAARDAEREKERHRAEAERVAKERELEQAKALAEAQRQRAEEQAAASVRQRRLNWALAVLLVAAAGTLVYASGKNQQARSQQIVAEAGSEIEDHLQLALLFGAAGIGETSKGAILETFRRVFSAQPNLSAFLEGHRDVVTSVAFSPDSLTLASGSQDSTVILWEIKGRKRTGEPLKGHRGYVTSVAYSPDGKRLASGSQDSTVRLWDVASRLPIGEPRKGHRGGVTSVAFSPDGKTLASASEDGTVFLWNEASGNPHDSLKGDDGPDTIPVTSVSFGNENTLAAGTARGSVILWDLPSHTRMELKEVPTDSNPHDHGPVRSIAFAPDLEGLAAVHPFAVVLWEMETRSPLERHIFPAAGRSVTSAAFPPTDGPLALGSDDGSVTLWYETDQPRGQPFKGHGDWVTSVAFSPDGQTLASASGDGTVILWDMAAQQAGKSLEGHGDYVTSVAFSPDGLTIASGSEDRTVIRWDAGSGVPQGDALMGHEDYVRSVAFSPDSRTLASGSEDRTVRLWDVETGAPVGPPLAGHEFYVTSVAFSPDSVTLASGSMDGTVILWDLKTGKQRGESLAGHGDYVMSVAFSPDGRTLASGGMDGTVILWDVATRNRIGEPLKGHRGGVTSVAFGPDGLTLASGSEDRTVILWDVKTRKPRGRPLRGHKGLVTSVAFSPDSLTLASGSNDKSVILWDVVGHQRLGEPLKGHVDYVRSVAFRPDGQVLASASEDRTVKLWNASLWKVDIDSWKKEVCSKVSRNLTHAEWVEHLGPDIPYRTSCPEFPVPPRP